MVVLGLDVFRAPRRRSKAPMAADAGLDGGLLVGRDDESALLRGLDRVANCSSQTQSSECLAVPVRGPRPRLHAVLASYDRPIPPGWNFTRSPPGSTVGRAPRVGWRRGQGGEACHRGAEPQSEHKNAAPTFALLLSCGLVIDRPYPAWVPSRIPRQSYYSGLFEPTPTDPREGPERSHNPKVKAQAACPTGLFLSASVVRSTLSQCGRHRVQLGPALRGAGGSR